MTLDILFSGTAIAFAAMIGKFVHGVYKVLTVQIKDLKEEHNDCKAENERLTTENIDMQRRLIRLESSMKPTTFPSFVLSQNGSVKSMSSDAVILLAAPAGLGESDFIGKELGELPAVNKGLIEAIMKLRVRAARHGQAGQSGIEIEQDSGLKYLVIVSAEAFGGSIEYHCMICKE